MARSAAASGGTRSRSIGARRCIWRKRRPRLAAASTGDVVLVAENLRGARVAFDRLTGRAGVEDVLDALFWRFCLGK